MPAPRERRGHVADAARCPEAIATYWNLVQPKDKKKLPTEDADIDAKFTEWLRGSSVWVPLKTFLKAKPDELVAAGYSEEAIKSFLDAYRELEQAEVEAPGAVAEPVASKFLTAVALAGRIGLPAVSRASP